jgi:TatA/E family protein of Tat protein translocase
MGKIECALVVLALVLLLVVAKKLPEFGRGIGESVREIKRVLSEDDQEFPRRK